MGIDLLRLCRNYELIAGGRRGRQARRAGRLPSPALGGDEEGRGNRLHHHNRGDHLYPAVAVLRGGAGFAGHFPPGSIAVIVRLPLRAVSKATPAICSAMST